MIIYKLLLVFQFTETLMCIVWVVARVSRRFSNGRISSFLELRGCMCTHLSIYSNYIHYTGNWHTVKHFLSSHFRLSYDYANEIFCCNSYSHFISYCHHIIYKIYSISKKKKKVWSYLIYCCRLRLWWTCCYMWLLFCFHCAPHNNLQNM